MTNCTIKVKVGALQRIMRSHYAREDAEKLLFDPSSEVRCFDNNTDVRLLPLMRALDLSMIESPEDGRQSGIMKDKRSLLKTSDIQNILRLANSNDTRDFELAFGLTILLNLGVRGGSELRKMHWG